MVDLGIANLAQSGGAVAGIILILVFLVCIAVTVAAIMGSWKMFAKAGQPGWASIVPIYNAYIMTKIVNRPVWWMLLIFIGIGWILVSLDLAKCFGKSTAFAVGLILLAPIFVCILGFGSAQYQPAVRQ